MRINGGDVRYRDAKPEDVASLKELFAKTLPMQYDESFYTTLARGIKEGKIDSPGAGSGKFVVKCAIVALDSGEKRLAGAIAVHTMNLHTARETKRADGTSILGFDIIEKVTEKTQGAYILMIGVMPKYRRNGIARELVHEALREVLANDQTVQAVFLHTRRGNVVNDAFYDDLNFTPLGYVPSFYGKLADKDGAAGDDDAKPSGDATVWAAAFHNAQLVSYVKNKGETEVNLSDPALKKAKKTPKWVIDCGLQFGLPICVVAVLFAVSYALVLLGPLRGISRKYIKDASGNAVPEDVYDSNLDVDEDL